MSYSQVNNAIATDSYKETHHFQYPEGTKNLTSYIEARKDNTGLGIKEVSFFGLQAYVKKYLLNPMSKEDIEEAEMIVAAQGIPFAKSTFERVLDKHGGYFPVRIRAVKEGTQVPISNVLVTAEATDPECSWMESFLETTMLQASWYGTTVATISRHCKKVIFKFLVETCDTPIDVIPWSLADFGYRGNSSQESAAIAGAAHLTNFLGTDVIPALSFAHKYYNAPYENLGFSVVASEHSTTVSWGKNGEVDFYRHMIKTCGGKSPIISLVVDSYNVDEAVSNIFGKQLKDEIINCGSRVVIRLDSGDPIVGVLKALHSLCDSFGFTENKKGYKVLNHVRVLQGDGINPSSMQAILTAMKLNGYSAENVVFGMGGGLHQSWTRDSFSFAMKASAIQIGNEWKDCFKDPISGGKTSKKGRLALIENNGVITTVQEESLMGRKNLLEVVYENGKLIRDQTFNEVRRLAAI